MRYTEEQINKIIGWKGRDGKPIDNFNLHGVVFMGNVQDGEWDISKTYTMYSEHSVPIHYGAFEVCESEEDVRGVFAEEFERSVNEKLI